MLASKLPKIMVQFAHLIFFGFNNKFELQYRGRFDESRKETALNSTRDLFKAMKLVAETGNGPKQQIASIGCSIKWKTV